MCGLMGYTGNQAAAPIILEGLKRLEYRGYDSAGIATLSDNKIHCKKGSGRVSNIENSAGLSLLPGQSGIGHVRWATNGRVNDLNAHPHLDCRGEIAVVHNGIIENFKELKAALEAQHTLVSETDTEVIPHLLESYTRAGQTLGAAAMAACSDLEGPYAYLAISTAEPGTIIATCNDMPLVIGLGSSGNYASSDIDSLPLECRQAAVLENQQVAVISASEVCYFDARGKHIHPRLVELNRREDVFSPPDGGHFMLKEIQEQPWAIRQALLQDRELIDKCVQEIQSAQHIIFVACGSSRFAALLGRYLFSRIGKTFSEVIAGSEFAYFEDAITPDTLVIAVSQSGETADVLTGVRTARKRGARIISIINRRESQLSRLSDYVIPLNCGPEICVAATKSFTAELVVFYILAFRLAGRLNEVLPELRHTADLIHDNLEHFSREARMLVEYITKPGCIMIARGSNLHVANEAALKLKEVAYMYTESIPAGELKHGTIALIEEGTVVFAVCPNDYTFNDTLANAEEAKARGAFIVGISDRDAPVFDLRVAIPTVPQYMYPLVSIIPMQFIAYYLAVSRHYDPDKPRNLAKSVTVK
jgi:glucosamine--fructose-6-phosphate aminotransferase (isomerizing)